MNPDSFRQALIDDGYLEVVTKSLEPDCTLDAHSHPYDVRALVLEGEITIECEGVATTYSPGDVLVLGRDRTHSEKCGARGMTFMVGRRHAALA